MDERILVEVYVPAALLYIDVALPAYATIADAVDLMMELVRKVYPQHTLPDIAQFLYWKRRQCILANDAYIGSFNIPCGEELLLL